MISIHKIAFTILVFLAAPIQALGALPAGFCGFGPNFVVPCPLTGSKGPAGKGAFGPFVSSVVSIALLIVASISVIFLIVGAYRYITAHGNEEQMESAKKTMTSSIIGLVIVLMAAVIVTIISQVVIEGKTGT